MLALPFWTTLYIPACVVLLRVLFLVLYPLLCTLLHHCTQSVVSSLSLNYDIVPMLNNVSSLVIRLILIQALLVFRTRTTDLI